MAKKPQPQYVMLCHGDEGMQLLQRPYPQIRLYQLPKINKQEILKHLIKHSPLLNNISKTNNQQSHKNNLFSSQLSRNKQSDFFNKGDDKGKQAQQKGLPIHLITVQKQRNYYIDKLLQNNEELIIENDPKLQAITRAKVSMPLLLEVVYPNSAYKLQSHTTPTLGHFDILHKISQGAFAQIFLVETKYDRHLYAMKKIQKRQLLNKSTKKQLHNQIQILKYRHWGKLSLKYTFENQHFIYLVMDYCPMENLYHLIKTQQQNKNMYSKCQQCHLFTKQEKIHIWLQVAFTIAHMHSKGFLYRDLKPQNILIDYNGMVKLCDFGHSVPFSPSEKFTDLCGTLEYITPEIVNNQPYDKTVDIYALGILLYELIDGKSPFSEISFQNMKELKSQSQFKYDKKEFTKQEISLISALTCFKPQQRLGASNTLNIFRHPFFQQQHVKQLIQKVIRKQRDYDLLYKLHCGDMQKKQEQHQLRHYDHNQNNMEKFLTQNYNFLTVEIEVEDKIGPKFSSAC